MINTKAVIKLSKKNRPDAFVKRLGQTGGFAITWKFEQARKMTFDAAHGASFRIEQELKHGNSWGFQSVDVVEIPA